MAKLPSLARSSTICARCAFRAASAPQRTTKRWIGIKMLGKMADAEASWVDKSMRIRAGKEKSMLTILEERQLVEALTGKRDDIDNMLTEHRLGAYVGIDPTAASLHVGHMLPLMSLFWMYVHGYQAVTLLGGTTAKIGDPTGRDAAREKVHRTVRVQNMANMHFQLKALWVNVEAYGRKYGYTWEWAWKRALLNNTTWFQSLTWEEALQIIGHTPTGPMLAKRTVKNKLGRGESGLTYAELSYPLMQAWDWWHMYNTLGVRMQIGGSDQYGNITAGIQAVKHIAVHHPSPETPKKTTEPPFGFTTPLLTTSSGAKFGKSAGNAIWLDSNLTSTFDLYKYFLGTTDADVDINQLLEEHTKDPSKRVAQHKLAAEFVELVHGAAEAKRTVKEHQALFQKKPLQIEQSQTQITDPVGASVLQGAQVNLNNRPVAHLKLPRSFIQTKSIGKILHACGLAVSAAEGHRLASQQSVYIGGGADRQMKPMSDGAVNWNIIRTWAPEETRKFLVHDTLLFLRRGKNNIRFIEVVDDDDYERLGLRFPGDGKGEIDLTVKQVERPPSAIVSGTEPLLPDPKIDPKINFRPALENVKRELMESKWTPSGALRIREEREDFKDEDLDVDPDDRIEALQRNLELEKKKEKLKYDVKHAVKGKFTGHGRPREPAPRY
ncbi:hypothetical protein BJ878DRAFT_534035 [Calycina marina]|uniref:Tyrosine--tRNA ligase n=1 Tax=Calycina marina TaxID=1763456 RepID=A0A9P7Z5E2_9HELO|nr:hypothetical protein BJ878DRAFT_534035 [Calycina marina]